MSDSTSGRSALHGASCLLTIWWMNSVHHKNEAEWTHQPIPSRQIWTIPHWRFSPAFDWFVSKPLLLLLSWKIRWLPLLFDANSWHPFVKPLDPSSNALLLLCFKRVNYGLFGNKFNVANFTTQLHWCHMQSCWVRTGQWRIAMTWHARTKQTWSKKVITQNTFIAMDWRSSTCYFQMVCLVIFGCSMTHNNLGAFNMSPNDEYLYKILLPIHHVQPQQYCLSDNICGQEIQGRCMDRDVRLSLLLMSLKPTMSLLNFL